MADQEAHKQHYVPEFLLKPWAIDGELRGYWWNSSKSALSCRQKGPKAFCRGDLWTLRGHALGHDALEKVYFGDVDTKGADARNELLASGPAGLSNERRCNFARLLLSLEWRRPTNVAKLRSGGQHLAKCLDSDPEILAAMEDEGLSDTPSLFYEHETGALLEDRALLHIQELVDDPNVGGQLINACWHVVRLGPLDGSLILSDRPLIRIAHPAHPGAIWVLPLSPRAAFVAANDPAKIGQIKRASARRFAKECNALSASQAERFVFSADTSHEHWIGKYLSRCAERPTAAQLERSPADQGGISG
jgi:Protein of unknown function (DUF4238)